MAITVTAIDEGNDPTDGTSFNIGSVTLANNKLYLFAVYSGNTGGTSQAPSSITGTHSGLTWVQVDTCPFNGGNQRVTMMRAMGSSVSSGTIIINFSGTQERVMWQLFEIDGVDTGGTNGSAAVINPTSGGNVDASGNNTSFNLPSAVTATNATIAFCMTNSGITFTEGSGYTPVGTQDSGTSPSMTRFTEWDSTANQTISYTTTGTPISGTVAAELKIASNREVTVGAQVGMNIASTGAVYFGTAE